MTLNQLITFSRKYMNIKETQFDEPSMIILLNKAKDSVTADLYTNSKIELNPRIKLFNIEAEKQTYSIVSDIADDYLLVREAGIEWYDGSQWTKPEAVTRSYLDEEYPNWINDTSSDVKRYFIEGDNLVMHYTPDTSLSSGGRLYYMAKFANMASDGDYPFHKQGDLTIEIPQYSILDDCIFAYMEWKLTKSQSKNDSNSQNAAYTSYLTEIGRCGIALRRRPDVYFNKEARYQGRKYTR